MNYLMKNDVRMEVVHAFDAMNMDDRLSFLKLLDYHNVIVKKFNVTI